MTAHPIIALGGVEDAIRATVSGAVGRLAVLPIAQLYVDDTYQRAISVASAKNIRRICIDFDWAKFLPVIVAQDGDRYFIVDGQHRTTAAATIGITDVPCYVLSCSPSEAAAAFAAINGNVTPMQAIDIWFAELAAGAAAARELKIVLDAAGVRITRKKEGYEKGETRSINVLRRALALYGAALLTTILQCITETGNGNPGMIIGAVVNGIGMAIRTKPEMLANPSKLFDVFDRLDIADLLHRAQQEHARTGNVPQQIVTRMINAALAGEARDAA